MWVFTEVSSINTRWVESSSRCSRIQRRRARATSARSCSLACRALWDGPPLISLPRLWWRWREFFKEERMTRSMIAVLGIDLGKSSCSLVGLDAEGAVVLRKRMRRETVIAFATKLPACVVAMEACCGAHHLGRLLADLGHEVRLMSQEYVRPYVKAQKNDNRDAEAIAEAATRPTRSEERR